MFGIAYGVDFIEPAFSLISLHFLASISVVPLFCYALISFQLHVVSISEWKQSFS